MFLWRAEVAPGVHVAFTDTRAGNLALHVGDDAADVRRRRRMLEDAAGLAPGSLRFMDQVHGTTVEMMEPGTPVPTADGMVSRGLPLAVMVADCIPAVLVGQGADGPVVAAVHAGRPGIANGILPAAVERMQAAGATGIRAWLGPSICGSCYEVPVELAGPGGRTGALNMGYDVLGDRRAGSPGRGAQPTGGCRRRHRICRAVHAGERPAFLLPPVHHHRAVRRAGVVRMGKA